MALRDYNHDGKKDLRDDYIEQHFILGLDEEDEETNYTYKKYTNSSYTENKPMTEEEEQLGCMCCMVFVIAFVVLVIVALAK